MYAADAASRDRINNYRRGWITRFVAAGIGLSALGASMIATSATETREAVVRVSAVDRDSRSEAELLYRRIESAADEVCGNGATRVLYQWRAQRSCAADAIARAVKQIDSPVLTAVHLDAVQGAATQRTAALAPLERQQQ